MAKNRSGGILLFRRGETGCEVLLVHPGGPYFAKKDAGYWTVPKGEIEEGEAVEEAAVRELLEETGIQVPEGARLPLGEVQQKGGKRVLVWAVATPLRGEPQIRSGTFEIEWPPKSGKRREFPEIDQGRFFELAEAKRYIMPAQLPFLERLEQLLSERGMLE